MRSMNTQKNVFEFAGLTDWVHIFSAGEQTSSDGRTTHFSVDDLDSVIAHHDPERPAPHIITHKQLYSPFAYGHAAEIKRDGDHLFIKSKNIEPQFESLVKNNRLPERSVQLRPQPDGGYKLGHIAWLGAEPPAVDGLAPVQFNADESAALNFSVDSDLRWTGGTLARIMRRVREWFVSEHDIDTADRVIPEWDIEQLNEIGREPSLAEFSAPQITQTQPKPDEDVMTFSQQQLDDAVAAAVDAAVQPLQTKLTAAQAAAAEFAKQKRAAEFSAMVSDAVDTGKLTPAMASGVAEFCAALDADTVLEFSAGTDNKKTDPVTFFMEFVSQLPTAVAMGKLPPETPAVDADDAQKLANAAMEYVAAEANHGRTVSIPAAMTHVLQNQSEV